MSVEQISTGTVPGELLTALREQELSLNKEGKFPLDAKSGRTDGRGLYDLYLRDMGYTPLLSSKEEVNLARKIEKGRQASKEFAKGPVAHNRLLELQTQIREGLTAQEELVIANTRLVISVAKKYCDRGVPFLDLIQEGNIGLIRAAKKFDYHRGTKFSTYATWWIRQSITRAIGDKGRTIRVPVHANDQIYRLSKIANELTQTLNCDPTAEELAAASGLPLETVKLLTRASQKLLSLETPVGEDEDSELGDFIEEEAPPVEDSGNQDSLKEEIASLLNELPCREAMILQRQYGLLDGKEWTQKEIGRRLGFPRYNIQKIKAKALARLRRLPKTQPLRSFLK